MGRTKPFTKDFFVLYIFILCGCSWLWAMFRGHINSTLLLKQLEIKSYSPGSSAGQLLNGQACNEHFLWALQVANERN